MPTCREDREEGGSGFVLNRVVGKERDRGIDEQTGRMGLSCRGMGKFDGPISGLFFSSLAVPLALPALVPSPSFPVPSGPPTGRREEGAGQTTTIWLLLLPSATSPLFFFFLLSPLTTTRRDLCENYKPAKGWMLGKFE